MAFLKQEKFHVEDDTHQSKEVQENTKPPAEPTMQQLVGEVVNHTNDINGTAEVTGEQYQNTETAGCVGIDLKFHGKTTLYNTPIDINRDQSTEMSSDFEGNFFFYCCVLFLFTTFNKFAYLFNYLISDTTSEDVQLEMSSNRSTER